MIYGFNGMHLQWNPCDASDCHDFYPARASNAACACYYASAISTYCSTSPASVDPDTASAYRTLSSLVVQRGRYSASTLWIPSVAVLAGSSYFPGSSYFAAPLPFGAG